MPVQSPDPFLKLSEHVDPHKNPYVARLLEFQENKDLPVLHGSNLKPWVGHWRDIFPEYFPESPPPARLCIEIGCHYGRTLSEVAADHPDVGFIGIDITFKRVIKAAERAKRLGLRNVVTILSNAQGIDQLFAPGEIDGVITFFPDPWLKKRKAKNRLLDGSFGTAVHQCISAGGFFWLKTDQESYFNEACSHLEGAGMRPADTLEILGTKDYSSSFEQLFKSRGQPTFEQRLVVVK